MNEESSLSFLARRSRGLLTVALAACIVGGVSSVLLLAQINTALTTDFAGAERKTQLWLFAVTALTNMLCHMISGVIFAKLGQFAHAEIRRFVADHVMNTELRRLEAIGGPRIHSALSDHSASLVMALLAAPVILVNGVIVVGCLVYMAWLSWQICLIAIIFLCVGATGYHVAHRRAIRHFDSASREQDRLFAHFRSLIDGAKELRLNRMKRCRFAADVLNRSIETVHGERARGQSIFSVSARWGQFLVYAFIGLVAFVLAPDIPEHAYVMTGFALVTVYMAGPLETLLLELPSVGIAQVSAARIDEIVRSLRASPAPVDAGFPPATLQDVTLRGLTHRYYHDGGASYEFGPVDLTFKTGQVTFLVGGNGSGKTTLAKLLVGLYRPEQGELLLNGTPVRDEDVDHYRQHFSAIFSDFHLFETLLETCGADVDDRGNRLIELLQLRHKVQVRDGAFDTQALSQGQRKRLALIVACMEDRPFLVFDEWAADQDPVFREVFYREVLAELRAAGKAIVVISHDDRYFHLADQLIRLEMGRVVTVTGKTA